MREIPCEIICDLLVLYEDEVCSTESRQMIEEHIKHCEKCRMLYEETLEEIPEILLDIEEAAPSFEQLMRKIKRMIREKMIVFGVVLLSVLIFLCIFSEYVIPKIRAVPAEDVQVTELYQLKSGDIYCTFKLQKPVSGIESSGIRTKGSSYNKDSKDAYQTIQFMYSLPFENIFGSEVCDLRAEVHVIFSLKNVTQEGYVHSCSSVIYKGKGRAKDMVIWKKGQKIEDAPEAIEKEAALEYLKNGGYLLVF